MENNNFKGQHFSEREKQCIRKVKEFVESVKHDIFCSVDPVPTKK